MGLIDKIIEFITNNPGMAAIGWIATVVGMILAIVVPIVTRKKKKLSFRYVTTQLIEAEVANANNIEVLFNKKPIQRLSVTKFIIKNTGNTTIRLENMYDGHGLKIIAPNVKIISVDIEGVSRDIVTDKKEIKPINHGKGTVRLRIKDLKRIDPDDEYGLIPIDFKVFEKKDFMVLNIFHTGDGDALFDLVGIGEELKIVSDVRFYEILEESMNSSLQMPITELAYMILRILIR